MLRCSYLLFNINWLFRQFLRTSLHTKSEKEELKQVHPKNIENNNNQRRLVNAFILNKIKFEYLNIELLTTLDNNITYLIDLEAYQCLVATQHFLVQMHNARRKFLLRPTPSDMGLGSCFYSPTVGNEARERLDPSTGDPPTSSVLLRFNCFPFSQESFKGVDC